jgi:glyoxalase family protein
MEKLISGIHHVTAIASDGQTNLNFYAGILGLRLVKKTINFDAPEVYHLYYGDERGSPDTIMTFFIYPDIPKGRKGNGQVTVTSFSISEHSIAYWIKRLTQFNVKFSHPQKRFGSEFIYFEDEDGLGLELVANAKDPRHGFTSGPIPAEHAIKGFYGITLSEQCFEKTSRILTEQMDHTLILEQENRLRFSASHEVGSYVDVTCHPEAIRGIGGTGTVHHVAFATENEETQLKAREKLMKKGLNLTPVLNREYFHSIYFREPGSVLFEIATLLPGFAIDEDPKHLGEGLKLPPWQEKNRKIIEQLLPSLHLDVEKYK